MKNIKEQNYKTQIESFKTDIYKKFLNKMNYSAFDLDMNRKNEINGFNEYFIIPNELI